MGKTITGKRVTFKVEMYWRGKTKIPSIGVQWEGDNYAGLPQTIDASAFLSAAKDLCRQLVDAGELD